LRKRKNCEDLHFYSPNCLMIVTGLLPGIVT
jgi:hypothetical protein